MNTIPQSLTKTQLLLNKISVLYRRFGMTKKTLEQIFVQYCQVPTKEYRSWWKGKEAEDRHFKMIRSLYNLLISRREERQLKKFISEIRKVLEEIH